MSPRAAPLPIARKFRRRMVYGFDYLKMCAMLSTRLRLLQAGKHGLDKFTGATRQRIHAAWVGRPRYQWFEDVLERQWHRDTHFHHRSQELIVIDLAEAGSAIFALRCIAVVFDG